MKLKQAFLSVALTLIGFHATAQTEPGQISLIPQVGVSIANTSSDLTGYKAGWSTGVTAEYQLTHPVSLSAGLFFSMEGGKIKDTERKLFLDYLNIPLLANYYVTEGFAVKAGAQLGFQVYGKEKVNGEFVPFDTPKNKVAFAIPVGLSYEYAHILLDVRYNIGLTNMLDMPVGSMRSQDLMITLGYKFTLN
ncbi:MAG: porin family protein [Parabacteroides sp.]